MSRKVPASANLPWILAAGERFGSQDLRRVISVLPRDGCSRFCPRIGERNKGVWLKHRPPPSRITREIIITWKKLRNKIGRDTRRLQTFFLSWRAIPPIFISFFKYIYTLLIFSVARGILS